MSIFQPVTTEIALQVNYDPSTKSTIAKALSHAAVAVSNNPTFMALKNEHVWLLAIAAVLRLAIFAIFPGLADLLANRVEISTPVTSFKRCEERLEC